MDYFVFRLRHYHSFLDKLDSVE